MQSIVRPRQPLNDPGALIDNILLGQLNSNLSSHYRRVVAVKLGWPISLKL